MGWIKSGDATLTAPQFHDHAARAASVLADLGIGEGDGVALYLRFVVTGALMGSMCRSSIFYALTARSSWRMAARYARAPAAAWARWGIE